MVTLLDIMQSLFAAVGIALLFIFLLERKKQREFRLLLQRRQREEDEREQSEFSSNDGPVSSIVSLAAFDVATDLVMDVAGAHHHLLLPVRHWRGIRARSQG